MVERRSLTGELSLVCTGPAADGYMGKPSAVGHQQSQLNLSSSRGRLMSSKLHQLVL